MESFRNVWTLYIDFGFSLGFALGFALVFALGFGLGFGLGFCLGFDLGFDLRNLRKSISETSQKCIPCRPYLVFFTDTK